jgi:hypothetical protein
VADTDVRDEFLHLLPDIEPVPIEAVDSIRTNANMLIAEALI